MSLNVSRILDGDLAGDEAKTTLRDITADPQQRDRYTVYGLVGDVLRGNSTPDDGFSMRIFQRMRAEGTKIEPGYDPLIDPSSPKNS
jgi:negative regulator of sigma E activity